MTEDTMRALRVAKFNQQPQIELIKRPDPAAGELRIRITACGLNFADLLMIAGTYQDTPALPFTLGMEYSGVVDALGEGVSGPPVGSPVAVFGGSGGLAEYACVPAASVTPLPAGTDMKAAAALQVAYGTSHVALDYKAALKPGEVLLVLGAAGGVGLTAVEVGKLMGATVIACARGADKLAVAKAAGADHLIDAKTEDIREAVKALGGADVVYDPVGGDAFDACSRAMARNGRLLVVGFASGRIPSLPVNLTLVKEYSVIGVFWGSFVMHEPMIFLQNMQELFAWYKDGQVSLVTDEIFPLSKAQEALSKVMNRKVKGKVVVVPDALLS